MEHPLLNSLSKIHDPRSLQGRSYQLHHVLAVAILAKLCGADSLRATAEWAASRKAELNRRLGIGWTRTPKKSGIANILALVDGVQLAEAISSASGQQTLHADGKVLRGESIGALSILGAAGHLCLARVAYGPGQEAKALREWIESGAAAEALVTADAAHAQKKHSKPPSLKAAASS